RRLADERQLRVGIADDEDEIGTARRELASLAIPDELAQLVERRGFLESGIFREQFRRYWCGVGLAHRRSRRGGHHAWCGRRRRGQSFHTLLAQLLDVVADRGDQRSAIRRR